MTGMFRSGDSTARIWNLADPSTSGKLVSEKSLVLKHCVQKDDKLVPSSKDVTSLDWNVRHLLIKSLRYSLFAVLWRSVSYGLLRRFRKSLDARRHT